jgi:regulatory protein
VIITDIKRQKRRKNRVSIFLDGKYTFSLDYDTVTRANLYTGDEITEEDKNKLIDKDAFSRARDYAYYFLSYRDRSEYEIKKRLLEREFPPAVVNEVLGLLRNQGIVDDRSFVNKWVDNVILSRPMGRMRVTHELRLKRVRDDIIDEVCHEKLDLDKEAELARKAADKKMKVLKNYAHDVARRRLNTFLVNLGFDFEVIRDLIKEYFGDRFE